jgi:hypothetical protein
MVLRGSFAKRIAMKKVMKVHEKSHARLDAFSRGMIWGMHLANVPRADIQRQVAKKDGSQPSLGAISQGSCYELLCIRMVATPLRESTRQLTRQLQDNYKTTTRQPTRQPTRQLLFVGRRVHS